MTDTELSDSKQTDSILLPGDAKGVRITVLGGGTFATALATVWARNGAIVTMYMRNAQTVKGIMNQHRNLKYFPQFKMPETIVATTDPEKAFKKADPQYVLHAIPVQPSEEFLAKHKQYIRPDLPIINLSKGIQLTTLDFMHTIIRRALHPEQPVAALHGPSFAKELMTSQPTGLVVASDDENLAASIQRMTSGNKIRVYTSKDLDGVELGGALKNIYAIAAGIASGMGFQYNTAALIVARGCAEMRRICAGVGGDPNTLNGLSGVGDLMLTCFGPSSRNRSVGVRLGKGEKLEDIIASMNEVAEGVPTAAAAVRLAEKHGVEDIPLCRGVADILAGAPPADTVAKLFGLPLRHED